VAVTAVAVVAAVTAVVVVAAAIPRVVDISAAAVT
jgi:hypothetical protein